MRNFIQFVRRFFNLILFLALEIVCIILVARTNTLQGVDILSSANAVSGSLYKKQSDIVYYFGLRRMNDSLINENMRLRLAMAAYSSVDTLKDSTVHRAFKASDSSHIVKYSEYIYRSARVINNSVSSGNNYITIDRGSDEGIKKNMAVISGNGVVGRIVNVSKHFSSALSALSIKQQLSAKLKDGSFSYVTWDGENADVMLMKDVPQQIKIKAGDSVFTTNYSFFPADIMIGTVFKTVVNKKNNLQTLLLHPATNFRNVQYVYVVENTMAEERKQLEDSTKSGK